jgi:NTE family protein
MARDKIAIACQGGGSQTAFTAGVLISLLNNKVHENHRIVSLSGTSGGAICAALAWHGLLKWAKGDKNPVGLGLESFWRDNATENPVELFLNSALIQYVQFVDHGLLPEWKTSPYTPWRQAWTDSLQNLMPQFFDFKGLLEKHLDLSGLDKLVDARTSPVLVIGAADVKSGEFKKFNSRNGDIDIDALMASAAVPSLSKAIEIGGGAYWDGLFSDNPPTDELIDDETVGRDNIPDQLWVIQINPGKSEGIPKTADEIIDRRNEMIGNASLYQDLQHICRVNKWLRRKAFKETYKKQHNLKIVDIYIIQMEEAFQKRLNYASKLDRDAKYIQRLIAHGEETGRLFLDNPAAMRFDPGS